MEKSEVVAAVGSDRTDRNASASKRGLTTGILAITTCIAFEALAIITAMPAASRDLGGMQGYGLVFSVYLTASLLGIVIAGGWADSRGCRAPLGLGLLLMISGLVISGTAEGFGMLTAGRAVSGLGGGLMVVIVYVIIADSYSQQVQPMVFGWLSAAWILPSLVGPAVAGVLAEYTTWRWVFFAAIPVFGAGGILVWRHLQADSDMRGARVRHKRSRILYGLALAAGIFGSQLSVHLLAESPEKTVSLTICLSVAAVVGITAAVMALRKLLPQGTLRLARGLPSVIATRGLIATAFFGTEVFIPLMLSATAGLTAAAAGIALSAGAAGWSAGAFLQARLRVPRSRLMVFGAAILAASLGALAAAVIVFMPFWALMIIWACSGVGMGMALSSTSVLTLKMTNATERGQSSASLQMADQIGGAWGTGLAGGIFTLFWAAPTQNSQYVFVTILSVLGLVAFGAVLSACRVSMVQIPTP